MKLKLTSFLLITSVISLAVIPQQINNDNIIEFTQASSLTPIEYQGHGVDFSSNLIAYRVNKTMLFTPNTLEAMIKVPSTAKGNIGAIFSNELGTLPSFMSLSINENGNLRVDWNGGEGMFILDTIDFRNDQWMFVSFVRDDKNKEVSIYVNGSLIKKFDVILTDNAPKGFHQIGSDMVAQLRNKQAFKGEIKEVIGYKSSLSPEQVKEDFKSLNKSEISYGSRGFDLAFSYSLTPGQKVLKDKSIYKQDMSLVTLDYLYPQQLYPTKDYTFAVIPDPQMVVTYHNHFGNDTGALDTTRDFLNSYSDLMKIEMTMCVGDLSNMQTNTSDEQKVREWSYVSKIFKGLDTNVKHIVTPGNHDYDYTVCSKDHTLGYFNQYFPVRNYNTKSYWGGAYDPTQTQNSYYLTEVAGVKYLYMTLDFGVEDEVLDWANQIADNYPDRRIVLLTHNYLNPFGTITNENDSSCATSYGWSSNPDITINNAIDVYNKFVKKHKNMFMTFSGHLTTDDIIYHESIGDNGNIIMDFLLNAQGLFLNDGLESLLGLFTFDEKEQKIYQDYYSTYSCKSLNIQNHRAYSFKGYTEILSSLYYDQNGNLKEDE